MPPTSEPADLVRRLVRWFRANRRPLPWRAHRSPYTVLLSEILCQQTRVETATPYYERFVARWPTLEALAAATEDEVIAEWAGLGYYARARNLRNAAIAAVERGGLPDDPEALAELPGIGPYTAGAIAALAFGRAAPAVDGNVERVIARLDARRGDPRSRAGRDAIRDRVAELLAHGPPDEVTEALMELGALVCTPRAPVCVACPWHAGCAARALGRQERIPPPRKRAPPKAVRAVAGLWRRDGAILVVRRTRGLLGRLWGPPMHETDGSADREALEAAFERDLAVRVSVGKHRGVVEHTFTHRELALHVYEVRGRGVPTARGPYDAISWANADSRDVGLSAVARRAMRL
jgi:A/G-specific adenine glycosylase